MPNLYAAKLDDSIYQYSALVPIESMGLADVLPDQPEFHDFFRNYPAKKIKREGNDYLVVSADASKAAAVFNARGLIRWEYRRSDAQIVDLVSYNRGFLVLVDHDDQVEIVVVDAKAKVLAKSFYPETNTPIALASYTYLTSKTIVLFDPLNRSSSEIVFTAAKDEVIRGGLLEGESFTHIYGYKIIDGKKRPHVFAPKQFTLSDVEGEFTSAVPRDKDRIIFAGHHSLMQRVFLLLLVRPLERFPKTLS